MLAGRQLLVAAAGRLCTPAARAPLLGAAGRLAAAPPLPLAAPLAAAARAKSTANKGGPNKRKRRAREQARKEREEAETAQLRAEAAARPGSTAAVLAAHAAALAQDSSARLDPKAIGTDLLRALRLEEMAQRRPEGVPEFHAGSILRVTYRNSASDRRPRSFVGLCVAKSSRMLGSSFTLRNVVEGTPVEVRFDTYAPWLENIEVLNLARRRRAKLFYLRNRPDKESFVSQSYEAVPRKDQRRVPVVKSK